MWADRLGCAVVVTTALMMEPVASAQRREGSTSTAVLQVQLPQSVRFGSVTVPAHTYRLTLGTEGFALADVETMVLVATVPAQVTEVADTAAEPSAAVKRSGAKVEIVVKIGNQVARAEGIAITSVGDARDVTLAGRSETTVEGGNPETQSERALVEQAVQLYLSGIKHCADQAHRNRWNTDEPRFVKCVCPVLAKWRLPKVRQPLRLDLPLAKGRSGFSFTAMPDGKPIECRVWTGPTPPAAAPAEGASTATPATPAAPGSGTPP